MKTYKQTIQEQLENDLSGKKDLKNVDFNLYDTGHFALETHGTEIADKIRAFLDKHTEK